MEQDTTGSQSVPDEVTSDLTQDTHGEKSGKSRQLEMFSESTISPLTKTKPTSQTESLSTTVNRFRVPVNSKVRKTNGTSGQNSIVSSVSVALQSSLASSLAARADANGSKEYRSTWKNWDMPSQRQIWALRWSARRISDSGCFGSPTAAAQNATGGVNPKGNTGEYFTLQTAAGLAGYPTPTASNPNDGESVESWEARRQKNLLKKINGNGQGTPLAIAAQLVSGYPTPTHREKGGGEYRDPEKALARLSSGHQVNLQDTVIAGWSTCSSRDHKDSEGMATTATNADGTTRNRTDQLPRQAFGITTKSLFAETQTSQAIPGFVASRVLNPAFSRWLMGYPEEWDQCSPKMDDWNRLQHALEAATGLGD